MRTKALRSRIGLLLLIAVLAAIAATDVHAQTLSGAALANALRDGGYVLVMRHANSPAALPERANAEPDNVKLERQLDETGKSTARAMGEAMKASRIAIGDVLSSPTFRARQTMQLAGFGAPRAFPELDEGGAAMESNADRMRSEWLRGKAAEAPRTGANTMIVTHSPNLTGAFGRAVSDAAMGETLVFKPDGKGAAVMVARVKIQEWPALAR